MKKLVSVMLSLLMIAALVVPSVFAEGETAQAGGVEVELEGYDDIRTNSKGKIELRITNNTADAVLLGRIDHAPGSNYQPTKAQTPLLTIDEALPAGGSRTYSFEAKRVGTGNELRIRLYYDGTDKYKSFTLTEINPSEPSVPVPENDPQVFVSSMGKSVFSAGEISSAPVFVCARSGWASDVRMTVSGVGEYENMFNLYADNNMVNLGSVYGADNEINPVIMVSPALKSGTYTIVFKFTYEYGDGQTGVSESQIKVQVHGRSNDMPYVSSVSFDKAEIGTDNKAKMLVNLVNSTGSTIKDVQVSLNTANGDGFSLYENFRPFEAGSVAPNKTATAQFSTYVSPSTSTGNYPVAFDISYIDGTGTVNCFTEYVFVQVKRSKEAENEGKTSQPRIIVSKYSTDVEQIKAGQSFTLNFSLKNTSVKNAVSNIKVVLGSAISSGSGNSAGGEVFFPAEGSNSFFIQTIGTNKEAENTIKLMARQDVEPGVYPIILKIDYESSDGMTYSSEEQISFSVAQQQRLDIQGFNMQTDCMMGDPLPVSFQYINKGKATIYNFTIDVEGDFTLDGGSMYVGNLTAGYNDFFDSILYPTGTGTLDGALLFKYENAQGDEIIEKKEFTVNVMEMDIPVDGNFDGELIGPEGPMGPDGMPIEKKGFPWVWVILGVLLVIGGGVTVLIIVLKKKKAKKDLIDDEN